PGLLIIVVDATARLIAQLQQGSPGESRRSSPSLQADVRGQHATHGGGGAQHAGRYRLQLSPDLCEATGRNDYVLDPARASVDKQVADHAQFIAPIVLDAIAHQIPGEHSRISGWHLVLALARRRGFTIGELSD